jgi:hypothetical protein
MPSFNHRRSIDMKTKALGIGTAAIAAGLISWQALAQMPTANGSMMTHGMGMGMAMGQQHMGAGIVDPATRLAAVKRELRISAQQESAWDTYSKAVLGVAASLRTQHQDQMAAMQGGPTGDHNAVMARMHEQRQQMFDTIKTAAEALLGALDESQQTKARGILPGLAPLGMTGHMGEAAR